MDELRTKLADELQRFRISTLDGSPAEADRIVQMFRDHGWREPEPQGVRVCEKCGEIEPKLDDAWNHPIHKGCGGHAPMQYAPPDASEPPTIQETLAKAHAAGGKAWDDVPDPEAVIEDMRGERDDEPPTEPQLCRECGGVGWIEAVRQGHHPNCDAGGPYCSRLCPVPIQTQEQCGACEGSGVVPKPTEPQSLPPVYECEKCGSRSFVLQADDEWNHIGCGGRVREVQ